ncbi:MAG: hypothetical protein RL632_137 [Bacteroidota bacterium]|jgi:hypothetical protein
MKKVIYLSAFVAFLALTSCNVLKNYSTEGFTNENNVVYYKGVAMAKLAGIEFALDDNKFVKEMTFELIDGSNNNKIHNLIAYLHSVHKDYEIEIEIPFDKMEGFK